jgi:hypothetical protein
MQMQLNLYNQGKIDMDWYTLQKNGMPQLKCAFQLEPMIENKISEYNVNYYDFNEDDEFE